MNPIQTPLKLTDEIFEYCSKLSKCTPVFLQINNTNNYPHSECFNNVNEHVALHGGKAQHGWSVYLMPRLFLEFEHHAVWQDSNSKLFDITPLMGSQGKLRLFLPCSDDSGIYTGLRRNNLRYSLVECPHVEEYLLIQNQIFDVKFKNQTPYSNEILLTAAQQEKMYKLMEMARVKFSKIGWKPNINDPCYCGAHQKFKNCHGIN